jgi:hypothetical protein
MNKASDIAARKVNHRSGQADTSRKSFWLDQNILIMPHRLN